MADDYLVNTNKTHREERFQDRMLAEQCVLAAYSSKEQIDCIGRDDVVFLYENAVGIIAFGTATGAVEIEDFEGEWEELHLMRLKAFRQLKSPICPATISDVQKQQTGKGVYFARTVQPLDERTGSWLRRFVAEKRKTTPKKPRKTAKSKKG